MRSPRATRPYFAAATVTLTGCLLTSDFDGIASGAASVVEASAPPPPPRPDAAAPAETEPDAMATDAANDSQPDAAPWQPTPCTGRAECLTFDQLLPGPDLGWTLQRAGSGSVYVDTESFATGPGALHTVLAPTAQGDDTNLGRVFKTVFHGAPLRERRWGFDARLGTCASVDPGHTFVLSAVGPAGSSLVELVADAEGDGVLYRDGPMGPRLRLPLSPLPRAQWLHLDFVLTLADASTSLQIVLDSAPFGTLALPVSSPGSDTRLFVGLAAPSPTPECSVIYDNFYFERGAE